MKVIKDAVTNNKRIRKSMINTFKGGEYYNIGQAITENAISNVNEMNKEKMQKLDEKEQKKREKYDPV